MQSYNDKTVSSKVTSIDLKSDTNGKLGWWNYKKVINTELPILKKRTLKFDILILHYLNESAQVVSCTMYF